MGVVDVVAAGRRLVATTLLDSALIERPARVDDGAGGKTTTWTVVAAAAACRFGSVIDPHPDSAADTIYSADTAVAMFALPEEGGPVIHEQDRITNTVTGEVWLAIGAKTPGSALAVVQRIIIRLADV